VVGEVKGVEACDTGYGLCFTTLDGFFGPEEDAEPKGQTAPHSAGRIRARCRGVTGIGALNTIGVVARQPSRGWRHQRRSGRQSRCGGFPGALGRAQCLELPASQVPRVGSQRCRIITQATRAQPTAAAGHMGQPCCPAADCDAGEDQRQTRQPTPPMARRGVVRVAHCDGGSCRCKGGEKNARQA